MAFYSVKGFNDKIEDICLRLGAIARHGAMRLSREHDSCLAFCRTGVTPNIYDSPYIRNCISVLVKSHSGGGVVSISFVMIKVRRRHRLAMVETKSYFGPAGSNLPGARSNVTVTRHGSAISEFTLRTRSTA